MFKTMQKGFTLIELMIVISIVGIIASIVIPQFMGSSTNYSYSNIYCNSGWQFLNGRQVLNEQGGGIRCGNGQ